MMITLLAAALLTTAQPVPAGPEDGPESRAAHYFAPPAEIDAVRVIDTGRLERAGPITLARSIGIIEEAFEDCVAMRTQMEELIGETYGSYSVHPDWVDAYQSCLKTRHAEITDIGPAITKRQREMMSGQEADVAVRLSDAMARLTLYRNEVKREVEAEAKRQKKFVSYYNTGNRPQDDMDADERRRPKSINLGGR